MHHQLGILNTVIVSIVVCLQINEYLVDHYCHKLLIALIIITLILKKKHQRNNMINFRMF